MPRIRGASSRCAGALALSPRRHGRSPSRPTSPPTAPEPAPALLSLARSRGDARWGRRWASHLPGRRAAVASRWAPRSTTARAARATAPTAAATCTRARTCSRRAGTPLRGGARRRGARDRQRRRPRQLRRASGARRPGETYVYLHLLEPPRGGRPASACAGGPARRPASAAPARASATTSTSRSGGGKSLEARPATRSHCCAACAQGVTPSARCGLAPGHLPSRCRALSRPAPPPAAEPIPDDPAQPATPAVHRRPGRAAAARRPPQPPRHPVHGARTARSNLHNDAYQTDTYRLAGPLGRDMTRTSTLQVGVCASVTFDSRGPDRDRLRGPAGPAARGDGPDGRSRRSASSRCRRACPGGVSIFNDFAGGGYFYLDHRDRAVIPTTTRHVYVVARSATRRPPALEARLRPHGRRARRATRSSRRCPTGRAGSGSSRRTGWSARSTRRRGAVRSHDTRRGRSPTRSPSTRAAACTWSPRGRSTASTRRRRRAAVTWREEYDNSGIAKPGQVHAGSGTTPTRDGRAATWRSPTTPTR